MSKEKTSKEPQGNIRKAPVMNSFRKRTFIEVFCKNCGERYNNDGEYEKVFQDKEEAIETITGEDTWTVKGMNAFCENCI